MRDNTSFALSYRIEIVISILSLISVCAFLSIKYIRPGLDPESIFLTIVLGSLPNFLAGFIIPLATLLNQKTFGVNFPFELRALLVLIALAIIEFLPLGISWVFDLYDLLFSLLGVLFSVMVCWVIRKK